MKKQYQSIIQCKEWSKEVSYLFLQQLPAASRGVLLEFSHYSQEKTCVEVLYSEYLRTPILKNIWERLLLCSKLRKLLSSPLS